MHGIASDCLPAFVGTKLFILATEATWFINCLESNSRQCERHHATTVIGECSKSTDPRRKVVTYTHTYTYMDGWTDLRNCSSPCPRLVSGVGRVGIIKPSEIWIQRTLSWRGWRILRMTWRLMWIIRNALFCMYFKIMTCKKFSLMSCLSTINSFKLPI